MGSQATVCGGGRYDGLVGVLKGKPEQSEPAVGFGMGLERLLLLIEAVNPFMLEADCDVFVVAQPEVYKEALLFAENLRNERSDLRVKMSNGSSLKSQFKKADKSGAKYTVVLGQDEIDRGVISVKDMTTGEQSTQDKNWFLN